MSPKTSAKYKTSSKNKCIVTENLSLEMTITHIKLKQINEILKTLQNLKQPKCTKVTAPSAIFSWAANSLLKSDNINQGPDILRKQITCRMVQRWRNNIGYRRQALQP